MQKMVQNACVQISNMEENIQNVGHWRQACMNVVMKGPGSLPAAIPYIYIYIFIYIHIYIWFYFCFYVHRTCSPQPGRCSTLIYNRHDHHHDHPDHHWIIIIIITTITPSHHYHHHIKICHPLWTRCWIRDQKSPPSMNNMLGRRGRLAPFLPTWPCLKNSWDETISLQASENCARGWFVSTIHSQELRLESDNDGFCSVHCQHDWPS